MTESFVTLDRTEGICPTCLRVVPATVVEIGGLVYLKKECPEHGPSTVYVWPDATHYRWMSDFSLPYKQPVHTVPLQKGCPLDCGLCFSHLRHSTLVEIEVTQRCNLRCPVCFMSAGDAPLDPDLKTLDAMFKSILQTSGAQTSIQLTGGEPTVRHDLAEIVRLGRENGFAAIEVNTNGLVISRNPAYLQQLADVGISGIYLQFDGLTELPYEQIRGDSLLKDKLKAIENCRAVGVQVVLAMTIIRGINHDQIGAVLDFAWQNKDVVAGVALQPAFTSGRFEAAAQRRLTLGDVVFMLAEQSGGLIEPYDLWPLGCSHPLCSCSTYLVERQGKPQPFTRLIMPQDYLENFDVDSPQGSVFADIAARQFPELGAGLSVVIMNYMDAMTMDLNRLKECSMTVAMEDGRLIPFCAYQLTDERGQRLYPAWGRTESLASQRQVYV